MESLDKSGKHDFLGYVFNFDEHSKHELTNIAQYTTLSLILIACYNEAVNYMSPPVDEEKGSFEVSVEILINTFAIIFGIFFINRIINFIPTYSGVKYQELNMINIIVLFIATNLIFNSRINSKIRIIVSRLIQLWNGRSGFSNEDDKTAKKKDVKVVKPLSNPTTPSKEGFATQLQPQQLGTTSISNLPTQPASQGIQQNPNFNEFYQQYPNEEDERRNEPMAANEFLGSGSGSSFL